MNFFLTVILFDILQSKISDINYCIAKVDEFKKYLHLKQSEFENIWNTSIIEFHKSSGDCEPEPKKMRNDSQDKKYFKKVYLDIYETIINFINAKFSSLKSLKFL